MPFASALAPPMKTLEFWPDFAGALLWTGEGAPVSLDDVPLPRELIERAGRWVAAYDDSKLPWEPTHDDEWLAQGRRLFVDLRRDLLEHGFDLQAGEDFWVPRGGSRERGRATPPDPE